MNSSRLTSNPNQPAFPGMTPDTTGQLSMAGVIGLYWVEVMSHGIIKAGTRFLVVEERADGWLVCWKNGVRPRHTGTLLNWDHVKRIEP